MKSLSVVSVIGIIPLGLYWDVWEALCCFISTDHLECSSLWKTDEVPVQDLDDWPLLKMSEKNICLYCILNYGFSHATFQL